MTWTWINAEYSIPPKQENSSTKQERVWLNYHSSLIPGETKEEAIERIKRNNPGCDFRNFRFEESRMEIEEVKINGVTYVPIESLNCADCVLNEKKCSNLRWNKGFCLCHLFDNRSLKIK